MIKMTISLGFEIKVVDKVDVTERVANMLESTGK